MRILVSSVVLRFGKAEPMAWNVSLLGANIVTSEKLSTVATKSAAVSAPVREVRFAVAAVPAREIGAVRTVSIMWSTPPVKLTF